MCSGVEALLRSQWSAEVADRPRSDWPDPGFPVPSHRCRAAWCAAGSAAEGSPRRTRPRRPRAARDALQGRDARGRRARRGGRRPLGAADSRIELAVHEHQFRRCRRHCVAAGIAAAAQQRRWQRSRLGGILLCPVLPAQQGGQHTEVPAAEPDHLQPLAFLLEVEWWGAAVAQGLGGDEVVEDGLADEAAVVIRDLAAGTGSTLIDFGKKELWFSRINQCWKYMMMTD